MLKLDFTKDIIFGFDGPNLCLLGNENDFAKMAKSILGLTMPNVTNQFVLNAFDFIEIAGDSIKVIFISKPGGDSFGIIDKKESSVIFELDSRIWERIFKFFILMSWEKKTYYLNSFEDCLRDFSLNQECHFICSSEF